jgi:predicted lactoylglutathione lyase
MIGYVMVGTNDLQHAAEFYEKIFAPLDLIQVESNDDYVAYAPDQAPAEIEFYVTKPFDQQVATTGNGTMIALKATSRKAVDIFHATALKNGGLDEGAPGPRPEDGDVYYAYTRDHDGNKICVYCPDQNGST